MRGWKGGKGSIYVYMCICANNVQILGFGGVGGLGVGGGDTIGGGGGVWGSGDRAHIYIYICKYTDIDTHKIIKYYLSFRGIHDFEQARTGMAVAVDQYCDGWTNWLISS